MASDTDRLLPLLTEMKNSGRALSLTDAAGVAAMSPWHLQREFAAAVGESPAKYQQRLRLERSALALRSTGERIIDIAFTAGFASHEAFTRSFRNHFGVSPKTYRSTSTSISIERAQRTAASGRCVGLHHISTDHSSSTNKEHAVPTSDITTETTDEVPTIAGRRRVDRDRLSEAIGDILPAAYGLAMEKGLTMTGPPFVRYVSESAAFVEIEAGVPLTAAAGEIEAPELFASFLPDGKKATAIHEGSYDTLGETHAAVDRWINEHGHVASGGPWEVYLTDPGEFPNAEDWRTQIVWPIAG